MPWQPRTHRAERGRRGAPGEPLFTLEEIADRLGLTLGAVKHLMIEHPGLDAWQAPDKAKKLYRLSDARKWYKNVRK